MPDYIIGIDMAAGPDMTAISRKCKDCGIRFPIPSQHYRRERCGPCAYEHLWQTVRDAFMLPEREVGNV